MEFRIQLDVFRGPLDLLLYLVRKQEVEITEVSLAAVAQQYVEYLEVLRELDLNLAGDFLEVASILTEMKSRMLLPRTVDEEELADETPHDLVRQLLLYKQYRDAASMLEERGQSWQEHFARRANDAPAVAYDPAAEPLRQVELWDLVQAFHAVLRTNVPAPGPSIVYDDTPIYVHMSRIQQRVRQQRRMRFGELFTSGMHKSQLVGIFLAVLELMRHQMVVAEQEELFGEIWITARPSAPGEIDPDAVDNYDHPEPEHP
jgi:segregation and condensation protein A